MIVLYASELAACVGLNNFSSIDEVSVSIWKRMDPLGYANALHRNHVAAKFSVQDFLGDVQISERCLDDTSKKASYTKKPLPELQSLLLELDDHMTDDVKKRIDSFINTERGKAAEDDILNQIEQTTQVPIRKRNDKFYKKYILIRAKTTRTEEYRFLLGGRVDGIDEDGGLIEVKNRRYKLLRHIPMHEKVQIHAYMCLTDKEECSIVEQYDDKTHALKLKFDKKFWDMIGQKAALFCTQLERLISNHTYQDMFLKTHELPRTPLLLKTINMQERPTER